MSASSNTRPVRALRARTVAINASPAVTSTVVRPNAPASCLNVATAVRTPSGAMSTPVVANARLACTTPWSDGVSATNGAPAAESTRTAQAAMSSRPR
jgi:hypothetical protein